MFFPSFPPITPAMMSVFLNKLLDSCGNTNNFNIAAKWSVARLDADPVPPPSVLMVAGQDQHQAWQQTI